MLGQECASIFDAPLRDVDDLKIPDEILDEDTENDDQDNNDQQNSPIGNTNTCEHGCVNQVVPGDVDVTFDHDQPLGHDGPVTQDENNQ